MRAGYPIFAVCAALLAWAPAQAATPQAAGIPGKPFAAQISPAPAKPAPAVVENRPDLIIIRYDHWTDADERAYSEFITAIGDSGCRTVNDCLHDPANPFRASDPESMPFRSDCADLPYVLRGYFAWKRGLPFSYEGDVEPRGHTRDIRYTAAGNEVSARTDVLSYSTTGYEMIDVMRDAVSSASFRIHPDLEEPLEPDMYSPAIGVKSIRPGTMVYDPNGHVAIVFRIEPNGRMQYIDAHPDSSVTRGYYDERFVRSRPDMGAGFKNWRPLWLVDAVRRSDGVYIGGHVVLAANKNIPDYSDAQFFGTGPRPADDENWNTGAFVLNGQTYDYYDYVRAVMAGGKLLFDPVREVRDMIDSNCNDLHYRSDAVEVALAAGIEDLPQPARLPPNIYGTEGNWEDYSTPSRDARLKTSFTELRAQTERFVKMYEAGDSKLVYRGNDLVADLIATYDREAGACKLTYARTDNSQVTLGYDDMRRRLFLMSFDPYQCVERRWGATDPVELSTCKDGPFKQAWYAAEQTLRNQVDRTYEAEMDFSLDELRTPGPGKGVAAPPDIDVRAYLASVQHVRPRAPQGQTPIN
ncbi:MAG: hypothetical protein ABSC92_06840 [Rhizomicrobium sp.]|jgi:hypothetical protein